ncbi:hypothetical protein F3Y22_tig00111027pilonHSYRG00770 [Hibiscus syriacus]|uniref:Reverse transcriptase zinc-binding domain-containing protein n=1 Tax=Hibiscus syriacus TaxID=106335 RepID=A0A6A2Z6F8_HIBSY|nr:hypothetical protein F3Y22_tig00111027pilonHSYRG00770 [Hibiscus syriacus]
MKTNGSRFNPLYESTDYANATAFEQPNQSSKTNQVTHSPSMAPQAQSSKARSSDHHAAKSKATALVCKPLTIPKVTAISFKGYHGKSSHQPRQNTMEPRISILDRSKHSTIVLSKNTNPNTTDDIISHATQGNSQHKLIPRKPPDTNHAQVSDETHLSTDGNLTNPAQYLVAILEPWISGGRADAFIAPLDSLALIVLKQQSEFNKEEVVLASSSIPSQDFVYDFGIRDIGFQCPEFIWNEGLSYAHLDRALCNSKWDESYPETVVHHLHRMRSDHRPLLLCIGSPIANIRPSQFRYFSSWLQYDDFSRMVEDNWVNSETLSCIISHFTEATDIWNKTVFGYIGTKNKIIMARLRGVNRSLNRFHSNFLINLEVELLIELEKLLDQEETLWKQRSRVNWIAQGCFPTIPAHLQDSMAITLNDTKIFEALKDMTPLKAPGHDGLHAKFFQKQWYVVSHSVCNMVKKVFAGGDIEVDINKTMIILIPKIEALGTFVDFRPISLCTVMYKLLTKIIVRRIKHLMPILIMLNQTSFIVGCSIIENVIINQEVVHSMQQLKTNQGWMAIKVDLEKDFDHLRWDFIQDSLTDDGFPASTIRVIMHCITSASMKIQWNSEYTPDFKTQRGIRKGHKVSKWKTHIYFSPNTITETKTSILSCLGFQEVDHMGKYLGVQVLHSRMKAANFDFIFDKFRGNGDTINFWNDEWVLSLRPLCGYARADAHVHPTQKLHNFIDEQNHWDVEALSQVLVPAAILHVFNIRSPEATDISDALVWKLDIEHHFTIKSAYTFLMEDSWSVKNNVWKNIWSITAPQRVCMFIWLAYKEKIMTNYERRRRMLTNDCSCATCGAAMESVIHVLRDCPPSRNLWLRVVPHSTYTSFFGIDLQSWITQNIQKQQPHVTNPTWSPPPRGWMCLNTDGVVATLDGRGPIGGVIRNSNRECITVFTKNVGTTSILQAELWSIYEGLLIARNLGIHRLWIQ